MHADLSLALGAMQSFGRERHSCSREQSTLRMDIAGRLGDFAMCCVELNPPLNVSSYSLVKADASVARPEQQLQVKLEDGSTHIRIVDGQVESDTKRQEGVEFSDEEQASRPSRACLVVMGKGPAPNTVRLRSISLDGCR